MGCGVVSVTGADGSEQLEAVVVGGFDDLDDRLDVVEIFNIEDGTWRSGECLRLFWYEVSHWGLSIQGHLAQSDLSQLTESVCY